MTIETKPALTSKCRICGHEGYDVTPGIWKSSKGKYHTIPRCQDHQACDSRKAAI